MAASNLTPDVWISLYFEERRDRYDARPTVLDLTAALYDFELVYEVAVVQTLPEYEDWNLDRFFIAGRSRLVRREHQLRVEQLSHESPLFAFLHVPAGVVVAGTLWPLYKAIELVYTVDVRLKVARKDFVAKDVHLERQMAEDKAATAEARLRERQAKQQMKLVRAEITDGGKPKSPGRKCGGKPKKAGG